jgi:hypothetical protein
MASKPRTCECEGPVCKWKALLDETEAIIQEMTDLCTKIKDISHAGYRFWKPQTAETELKDHCRFLKSKNMQCMQVLKKLQTFCTARRYRDAQNAIMNLHNNLTSKNRLENPYEDTYSLNHLSFQAYHMLGFCVIDMKKKPRCGWWFAMA